MSSGSDVRAIEVRKVADAHAAAMLGGLLEHPEMMAEVVTVLRTEDLRSWLHQQTYRALVDAWNAGKPLDAVGLADELLRRSAKTETVQTLAAYVGELLMDASVPVYIPARARDVANYALHRRLSELGRLLAHDADEAKRPAAEILAEVEQAVFALGCGRRGAELHTLRQVLDETVEAIDARLASPEAADAVLTGIGPLDDTTTGLRKGNLALLAARPSIGKTAVAMCMAVGIARQGKGVLFCSLEQDRHELAERQMSAESGVQLHFIRSAKLTENEIGRLIDAKATLYGCELFFDDTPAQTVLRIAANARLLAAQGKLAAVFIDYLQLIEPESTAVNRNEQVATISRRLKALAREVKVPLVALCQLNREAEHRGGKDGNKPRLCDLRDSGQLEQDADVVVLLHRPAQETGNLEFIVAKHRNGPIGDFTMRFDRERMRLEPVASPAFN